MGAIIITSHDTPAGFSKGLAEKVTSALHTNSFLLKAISVRQSSLMYCKLESGEHEKRRLTGLNLLLREG